MADAASSVGPRPHPHTAELLHRPLGPQVLWRSQPDNAAHKPQGMPQHETRHLPACRHRPSVPGPGIPTRSPPHPPACRIHGSAQTRSLAESCCRWRSTLRPTPAQPSISSVGSPEPPTGPAHPTGATTLNKPHRTGFSVCEAGCQSSAQPESNGPIRVRTRS
jgi:hypothetical protein